MKVSSTLSLQNRAGAGFFKGLALLFFWGVLNLASPEPVLGCKLADHSWQPVIQIEFSVPFPIVIPSTLGELSSLLPSGSFSIDWHVPMATFLLSRPWIDTGLLSNSSRPEHRFQAPHRQLPLPSDQPRVFVQTDDPTLVLGLFQDQNASGPFYQILFFYRHRVRLAVFSSAATTADEFSPGVFGSVVFNCLPLPPFVLAALISKPDTSETLAYFENTYFIDYLLKTGQIKRRRDSVQHPEQSIVPGFILSPARP